MRTVPWSIACASAIRPKKRGILGVDPPLPSFGFVVDAGRTVYEWEQSLEEVNLYIETPSGVTADRVDCKITPKHIRLGIKGNPPFIDVSRTSARMDSCACLWVRFTAVGRMLPAQRAPPLH